MKSNQIAQIALRTLSLFLAYRALEFGISQVLQGHYSLQLLNPPLDDKMRAAVRTFQLMTAIGAVVPLLLACALWFMAPMLSRLMTTTGESSLPEIDHVPLRSTLVQVAAIVIIAMAVTTLPKLIFDFSADHRRDPSTTLMTSRVFPDAIQFLAKVLVGSIMLLAAKKSSGSNVTSHAKQIAAPNGP